MSERIQWSFWILAVFLSTTTSTGGFAEDLVTYEEWHRQSWNVADRECRECWHSRTIASICSPSAVGFDIINRFEMGINMAHTVPTVSPMVVWPWATQSALFWNLLYLLFTLWCEKWLRHESKDACMCEFWQLLVAVFREKLRSYSTNIITWNMEISPNEY